MFLLLVILYLASSHPHVASLPVQFSQHLTTSDTHANNFINLTSVCPEPGSTRSKAKLIQSCFATIFACTWVAVHPDVPAPGDTPLVIVRRRLQIMFWALMAPEAVIFWAMRQWLGARKIASAARVVTYSRSFSTNGGFMLYENDQPLKTLVSDELFQLHSEGRVEFPVICQKEIEDRSKGDLLAKCLVVIQTSWFVIQCIARGIQGLVITELEVVTLAFAVLNGMMYYFWWNKPLDVRCPVPVFIKEKGTSGKLQIITKSESPPPLQPTEENFASNVLGILNAASLYRETSVQRGPQRTSLQDEEPQSSITTSMHTTNETPYQTLESAQETDIVNEELLLLNILSGTTVPAALKNGSGSVATTSNCPPQTGQVLGPLEECRNGNGNVTVMVPLNTAPLRRQPEITFGQTQRKEKGKGRQINGSKGVADSIMPEASTSEMTLDIERYAIPQASSRLDTEKADRPITPDCADTTDCPPANNSSQEGELEMALSHDQVDETDSFCEANFIRGPWHTSQKRRGGFISRHVYDWEIPHVGRLL